MLTVRQKLVCILWLAELKSYIRSKREFRHVYPNQITPVYRTVMRWESV